MANTVLQRNPVQIGDIFFSGSQPVYKGVPVAWVLDDNWAFKTQEECGISTDATPFVNVQAGQTFIIKKGSKYVFDRDTTVAMAYPQEITQDIIVENDIYANNYPTIVIEADKTPIVRIVASQTVVTAGTAVTLSGASSYSPDNPAAEPLTFDWRINGVTESTLETFDYVVAEVGIHDVLLIATDTDGRVASATINLYGQEYVPPDPIEYIDTDQFVGNVVEANWVTLYQITATEAVVNALCTLSYTAGLGVAYYSSLGRFAPNSFNVRVQIEGVDQYTDTISGITQSPYLASENSQFTTDINIGDVITLQVNWSDAWEYASMASVCSNGCLNGVMQISAQEP